MTKHYRIISALMTVFLCAASGCGVTLVNNGVSSYSIVIPDDPIAAEQTAAQEMAHHIEQMSGARLAIVNESAFDGSRGILLGNQRRLKKLGIDPDWQALGKEGYLLRTVDGHLVIAGGRPRGTLYGVYWVLEKYLGCRWFTPDTTVIPKMATVRLPQLDVSGAPAYEYREPLMFIGWGQRRSRWWADNFSQEYVARTRNSGRNLDTINRMSGQVRRIDRRYGGVVEVPYCGHNMKTLVPFDRYGDTHPEFYAQQKDGRRQTRDEQHVDLCLSNPEVALAGAETMRQWMRNLPGADSFFIGQSDASHYCQCDACIALNDKYDGRRSGPNLEFVNAVARHVEDEFPDKPIGTYAYQPTFQAPRGLKAHKNVVIWFCPITRCFCHPIHEGLINQGFYNYPGELETWMQIASKVYVYDYGQGSPGVDPPGSLLKLPETYAYYHSMGVSGVYVDAIPEIQIGYGFLRYWLMTQMMNDADFDFEAGLNEFMAAYYGPAAPHVRQFIDLCGDPASYAPATEKRAAIWYEKGSAKWNELRHQCLTNWRRLSVPTIELSYQIFEQARQAVANDPKVLQRVLSARMPVQYAMLEYLPADDPRLKSEAAQFFRLAQELQLRAVHDDKLDEYRKKVTERLGAF